MSSLTVPLSVNVDAKNKEEATRILKDLGLNMSTAINMFLAQIVKTDGIPFSIVNPKPSKDLLEALKEADDIMSGKVKAKGYKNMEELKEALLSDD